MYGGLRKGRKASHYWQVDASLDPRGTWMERDKNRSGVERQSPTPPWTDHFGVRAIPKSCHANLFNLGNPTASQMERGDIGGIVLIRF